MHEQPVVTGGDQLVVAQTAEHAQLVGHPRDLVPTAIFAALQDEADAAHAGARISDSGDEEAAITRDEHRVAAQQGRPTEAIPELREAAISLADHHRARRGEGVRAQRVHLAVRSHRDVVQIKRAVGHQIIDPTPIELPAQDIVARAHHDRLAARARPHPAQ